MDCSSMKDLKICIFPIKKTFARCKAHRLHSIPIHFALPSLLPPLLVVFHTLQCFLSANTDTCVCFLLHLEYFVSVILSLFSLNSAFWTSFLIAPKRLFSFHEECVLRAASCPRKSPSLLGSCTEPGVDPRSSGY